MKNKYKWIDGIPIMQRKKRLKLTFEETFTHYTYPVLFFMFAVMSVWFLITKSYKEGAWTTEGLLIFSLTLFSLSVFLFFIQYKWLNFKEIKITFTDKQFKEAVKRTVNELNWKIYIDNRILFLAKREWCLPYSGGEQITIIKGDNNILINSIFDPPLYASIAPMGYNRRNIKIFLKNLYDVLDNK